MVPFQISVHLSMCVCMCVLGVGRQETEVFQADIMTNTKVLDAKKLMVYFKN